MNEKQENSLDIKLRMFKNTDIKLMEKWLVRPHVKPWFVKPEDWLAEVRNRKGEFSFIKHFIVTHEDIPIGFCQYYDCTKADEDCYGKVLKGTYSIDYLIGDEEFLGRGLGKEIVKLICEKAFFKAHAKLIVVQPDKKNAASNAVLKANGFIYDEEKQFYYRKAPERSPQAVWDPWIGCKKFSEGCVNCYIYQGGERRGYDVSKIIRTPKFDLPVTREKNGEYKYKSGTLFVTCFRSDFLIPEADEWRKEAYRIIKERSDCNFLFLTKRIARFEETIPGDWGSGYENVIVGVTCENQKQADCRLPILKKLPIKHKCITLSPLLEAIDISSYLDDIEQVTAGGESGPEARICDFKWLVELRNQCEKANVTFVFKQTGSKLLKDGVLHAINYFKQHSEARNARLDFIGEKKSIV